MKHSRENNRLERAVKTELPMTNTQTRLKGCPHCGSNTLQGERACQESGELGDFNITCQVCLSQGPTGGTLEEAAARWNLRA